MNRLFLVAAGLAVGVGCAPFPGITGPYVGTCSPGDAEIPLELIQVDEAPEEATYTAEGSWELSMGNGWADNLGEEPITIGFSAAYCNGDDCDNEGTAKPQGTLIGYIDEAYVGYHRLMVLEGTENDDGSWSGTCWWVGSGAVADGPFQLDPL